MMKRLPVPEETTCSTRNSQLDLLRIVAMFLIVLHHITQGINSPLSVVPINVTQASAGISHFLLNTFFMLGGLGNLLFFMISAWFLLDKPAVKEQKIFYYVTEVWIISILFLIGFLCFYKGDISSGDVIKSLFPTTFANNWFVTCYILFYAVHGLLNIVIQTLAKEKLLKLSLLLCFLYVGCNTVKNGLFFTSVLIFWISLYFAIGYIKMYLPKLADSQKINGIILAVGLFGLWGMTFFTNWIGLHFGIFQDKVYHWGGIYSVFWVLVGFALLNLFRMSSRSGKIGFFSKIAPYMLLVYLIHENLLFRTYLRPQWFNQWYVYAENLNIVISVLLFALFIFIASFMLSVLFDECCGKMIERLSALLYKAVNRAYLYCENSLLKLK